MKKATRQWLFWTPRGLCLLFAVFVSLFAFDVFDEGYGFWETTLALLIHLIPTWIILLALAISWRREWVGGILFIFFGVSYVVLSWGRFGWDARLMISGPAFLVGTLFLFNWLFRTKPRTIS